MRVRRFLGVFLVLAAVVFVSLALYRYQKQEHAEAPGFVFASGRLEGDTITVATRIAGRVEALYFHEGQAVGQGKPLAKLSSKELEARLKAAQAAVRQAQAELAATKALLQSAQDLYAQRHRDWLRMKRLYAQRLVPKRRVEQAQLALSEAQARCSSLKARLKALSEGVARFEAQAKEVQALLEDTLIRAPAKGMIVRKVTNLGEVLSPGGVVALMVDLDQLYLKAYVPEKEIGKVALGQPARIYVDAFGRRFFRGRVGYIAKKAEFTPKEVQTKEARVKQVYAVKIYLLKNPGHVLTPGLPADALIQVDPKAPWPAHP